MLGLFRLQLVVRIVLSKFSFISDKQNLPSSQQYFLFHLILSALLQMRSSVICTVDDASYVVISESESQPTFHLGTKEHSPLYQGASLLQVLLLKKTLALFTVR